MLFDDTYKTIAAKSEGIYKEKGSKFIALAYPVTTEEEIKEIIAGLKKQHISLVIEQKSSVVRLIVLMQL